MPQFYRAGGRFPSNSLTPESDIPTIGGMPMSRHWLAVLAFALVPAQGVAGDYVGVLRPSAGTGPLAIPEPGFYWPMESSFATRLGAEMGPDGHKLKLGYRYSKYFAVETGYADVGISPLGSPFSATSARGRGFTMDTVGTLPLWTRVALYGRLGAWRSDGTASLVTGPEAGARAGAGVRYGLGLKYNLTERIGLQAEMERFSPLERWGPRESDTDQVTFGITWRY